MGAIGILVGVGYSNFSKYPAVLIAVLMLGAIHAHLFRATHNPYMSINALLMLCVSITLIVM
ncbi:DoxX family protein [Paenibacillus sp. PR3]|uniref:DoxX family protein n=1 Tax=Paenibacillus terricola TaxID=2763503 RepID=A0ABR8N1N5_9BACL|nr:DoxX family protein [Paenibacillus terricola]